MDQALKRLTRSRRDRVFGGVCAGVAEYLALDAALVRVLFVVLTLLSIGSGVVAYLLAWLIIPLEPQDRVAVGAAEPSAHRRRLALGLIIVCIGALALASSLTPIFWHVPHWRILLPLFIILFGLGIILWRRETREHWNAPPTESLGTARTSVTSEAESARQEKRPRRLFRIHRGRKIAGVCTGLGEYFDVDPTLIRLLWVALILMGGAGIILYLLAWLIMPLEESA